MGGSRCAAEPSLLNVNVRHLLLCLYDPTAVCLYLRYARVPRSRRCKEEIEEAEKGQAPPTRGIVLFGVAFAPAFGAHRVFFLPSLFCSPASALYVSRAAWAHAHL